MFPINEKFDYLYTENGRLMAVVFDENGNPDKKDVTPGRSFTQALITDGKGDTLVVSKKGQVMGVKEYQFAGDDRHLLNEYHRQLDSLGEWQINFTPAKNQTYAFDQLGSGEHGIFATDEYYPKSGNYDFRYKSVECGKNDKVIVDFGSYPQADSVVFKDKYGVKLKVVDGNILSFTGVSQADTNYIYAYRGDKKIGKLFLNTYQRKTYNVVLVSVNEAKILHEKNVEKAVKKVEESLNKVYNQCAVSFKITHAAISIDDLTTFSHGGSGILTVYNDDQKKVLRAYDNKMQDGIFYLFFIDNVTDKKDGNGTSVSGYMPRGYNAGFIYDGGSPHTIAHELGHGVAGLEHVFENSNNSGKTVNLMDYASGEELWHFQWDQIQDPSRVWMKWSKDESEGESIRYDSLLAELDTANATFKYRPNFALVADGRLACFAPSGLPIVLPKGIKELSFLSIFEYVPQGALTSFTTEDGTYVAVYGKKNDIWCFNGYAKVVGTNPNDVKSYIQYNGNVPVFYEEEISKQLDKTDHITLGFNTLCGVNIIQTTLDALSESERTQIKQATKYCAKGICAKRLPDWLNKLPTTEFKVKDPTNCLKTQAAIDFYKAQIEALSLSLSGGNDIKKEAVITRIALKIEEIASSNSEMNKLFDNYQNQTEQAFGSPILWDSEQKLLVLEEFLNNLFDVQKLNETLLKCDNVNLLNGLLRCLTDDRHLLLPARKHILTLLGNSPIYINPLDIASPSQTSYIVQMELYKENMKTIADDNIVKQVFKSVSVEEYKPLLDHLASDNLLCKIQSHLSSSVFAYFASTLFEYWVKEYNSDIVQSWFQYFQGVNPDNGLLESGTYPYTFVWHRSLFKPSTNIAYSSYWQNGKVKIDQYEGFKLFASHTSMERLVDPYKTVILTFETVPSFLSGQVEPNQTIAMPAFFFNWIATTQDEQDFRNGITIATTLLSLGLSVKDLIGAGANLLKAGASGTTIWALTKSTISFSCNAYGTIVLSDDCVTWLNTNFKEGKVWLDRIALGWGVYGIYTARKTLSDIRSIDLRSIESNMKDIRFAQIQTNLFKATKNIPNKKNISKEIKDVFANFNNMTKDLDFNNLDKYVKELKSLNKSLAKYRSNLSNLESQSQNVNYNLTINPTIDKSLLDALANYEKELVEYQETVSLAKEIRQYYTQLNFAYKQLFNKVATTEEKGYYEELGNIINQIKIDLKIDEER